jgi:hypothetical protein
MVHGEHAITVLEALLSDPGDRFSSGTSTAATGAAGRRGPSSSPLLPDEPVTVHRLRLRHPELVFRIEVTLAEHEGRWLATAMLADEPDIGTGTDPQEALHAALAYLGEPFASELAASAELPA